MAFACSSGSNNNDASGAAGTGASAGNGGTSAAGTSGSAGTSGNAGTTGRGGTTGGGGTGGAGNCLAFDAPGFSRGTACPNTNPACYGACDFDGEQYVGCISGSMQFTQCYPSCGACP